MTTAPFIRDIQDALPRADWSIGQRPGAPRYVTLHYNGPAVKGRGSVKTEIAQLRADARHHMRPGALNSLKGGDGLQYHFAITSDGGVYQCRDLGAVLWHCGHKDGNKWGLSVHFPLGEGQDATEAQWHGAAQLIDWLRHAYAIPVDRVLGHCEWGTKPDCPGPYLMGRLNHWRKAATATALHQALHLTTPTPIYEGPAARFPVALQGAAKLAAGDSVDVDAIVVGTYQLGDSRWLHTANGVGFIPLGATAGLF